jgi:RNA polymerase sigma-70 factor (ECF subfamily)
MYLGIEESTSTGCSPALEGFDRVYAFLYSRVGNRFDAEDLAQQVAVKALPRLRVGAAPESVRSYLYSTARSVLADFWAERLRMPKSELGDDLADAGDRSSAEPSRESAAWLEQVLAGLPAHYRQVLELRFLKGSSIREAAREMGRSTGAVKVMQLRALRAAAASPNQHRPERRPRAASPGSAYVPRPAVLDS